MDPNASCTHTYTHLTKCRAQQISKAKCDTSIPLHHCRALTHTLLVYVGAVYFQYLIRTTYHNRPGHGWVVMYRLISMVTMPLHGCVGSGLIANENRGFGVLLGRLLYTHTL